MPVRARRLPLRVRLAAISVVLVLVGLGAAGAVVRYELRSFLIDRVDQQFAAAEQPLSDFLVRGDPDLQRRISGVLPRDSYATLLPAGRLRVYFSPPPAAPPRRLVEAVRSAPLGRSTAAGYRIETVPLRQLAGELPLTPTLSGRLVMAIPLADVNGTLRHLVLLEVLVGLGIAGAVAVIAWVVVRRELRPLERIQDTAAAIAAGDLSRRVDADPVTEVGRLGGSLNAMLAQIELAFGERRASEERLRRFVADASHELRTPLTSVRGYAELFRRGASDRPEDLAVVMSRIEHEAERMGVLVEDLLLLARLDQGRPVEQERIDLHGLLSEMVSDHRLLHGEWPIELHADGDPHVVGDELRIRQAVGNLLTNARSHTPPGTPVSVSLREEDGLVAIEVADEGPGVPAEYEGKVFERFFRADPSRARASGGAGLGLAIVEAIAQAHGGRAEVSSRPGEGATFRILLPRDGAAAPAAAART